MALPFTSPWTSQCPDDSLRGNGKKGSKPVILAGGQALQPTLGGLLSRQNWQKQKFNYSLRVNF